MEAHFDNRYDTCSHTFSFLCDEFSLLRFPIPLKLFFSCLIIHSLPLPSFPYPFFVSSTETFFSYFPPKLLQHGIFEAQLVIIIMGRLRQEKEKLIFDLERKITNHQALRMMTLVKMMSRNKNNRKERKRKSIVEKHEDEENIKYKYECFFPFCYCYASWKCVDRNE